MTIGKQIRFAAPLFLMTAISLTAQTTLQSPAAGPFMVEQGSSFSASAVRPAPASSQPRINPEAAKLASDFEETLEIIRRMHVDGTRLTPNALTKSAIDSLLKTLDPHSNYFDAAEFGALLGEQESEYFGTGSSISNFVRNGRVETFVVATHPNSPAARANLRYGDRIVAVDGMPVDGVAAEIVRDKVRGRRGTTVRVTIERAADGDVEVVEMRRDRVSQPSIPNIFIVRDGVGYAGLSEGFAHNTAAELDAAMTELRRRGMTSLILDLRGNSGGILEQSVKVAEKFLPSGSDIISQRGRYHSDNRTWTSANRNPETLPLVVLVDGDTASASEVVAGALQDNDRALIIGQNTFGKGLVQNVVELPMGSGLTLTTARYYTPSGRSIQRSYANVGAYDYFNPRAAADPGQASSNAQARTITNRAVYGGTGITPDEITQTDEFNSRRGSLIDPIFFFVRDVVNRKIQPIESGSVSVRDRVRQSIIFDSEPVSDELLPAFREYAAGPGWKVSRKTIEAETGFIVEQLRYQLALATFGPESANRLRIQSDKQIARAIEALPRAAYLAEAARRVRLSAEHKKTRKVAFPAGQGRNRRN